MSEHYSNQHMNLSVPIFVDNDLGVDDDGRVNILSLIYLGAEEDCTEISIPLADVVDNLLSFWRLEPTADSVFVLNALAHALTACADEMYDAIDDIEGYRVELEAEQFPLL
jgi:hypothetical protein